TGHQEIQYLLIAITFGQAFANEQPKITGERSFRIIDRLVLADHAPQLSRQVARPSFQRRVVQYLIRLYCPRCSRDPEQEDQGDDRPAPHGPTPPEALPVLRPASEHRRGVVDRTMTAPRLSPSQRRQAISAAPSACGRASPKLNRLHLCLRATSRVGLHLASSVRLLSWLSHVTRNCVSTAPSRQSICLLPVRKILQQPLDNW